MKLLNIGFDNFVPSNVVISLVRPDSAPVKRKIDEAKKNDMLIDATFGRKTKCVIITKSNHIILSAIKTETIAKRFNNSDIDEELDE
jgi:hypothetical protein